MTKSQTELLAEIHGQVNVYRDHMPETGGPYLELAAETYKDGALSGKTKRLMALSGALTHGCEGCILYQADEALKLGATAGEVLEACAVAISLGGTMASAQTWRVVTFLQEKGLVEKT
jgi:AhpD family alkylhydroperoxidase